MQRYRFTTFGLMAVVMFAAIDCALIQLWEFLAGGFLVIGTLQLGLFRLVRSRGRARRFWAGFEVTGLVALIALVAYIFCPWSSVSKAIVPWTDFVSSDIGRIMRLLPYGEFAWYDWLCSEQNGALFRFVELIATGEVSFGVPMVLLALAGGLLVMLIPGASGVGMALEEKNSALP